MCKTLSHFSMSCFRNRVIVWLLLVIFACSFAPSVSFAQQPTATIRSLSGTVLVSGQTAKTGAVLHTGDTLQTQAGASVVLTLSDGSEIQLGEKTQINIADLAQTATGARVSSIKLLAGWLRALLSAQHQQQGSSFTIETPNAQIGVKFSQPDIEVSYDPAKQETVGIAHTVELIAINLLTNEKIVVPVGSSVVIIGLIMKVITGTTTAAIAAGTKAAETGAAAAGTTTAAAATGISTGTIVVIGAGALAAVGGVVALSSGSGSTGGSNGGSGSFTGTFVCEYNSGGGTGCLFVSPGRNSGGVISSIETLNLTQTGSSVTGTYLAEVTLVVGWGCGAAYERWTWSVTGTVNGTSAALPLDSGQVYMEACGVNLSNPSGLIIPTFPSVPATLVDNGRILRLSVGDSWDYLRQ